MSRYRVLVSEIDECWMEVEAGSEAEAKEMALEIVQTPWPSFEHHTSGNPRAVVTIICNFSFPDRAPSAGDGRS